MPIPARVFPLWTLQPHAGTLALTGCQTLSMPVIFALSLLDLAAATAPLPPAAAPPHGAQEGVLEGLLGDLAAAHGGADTALAIARAAAADALLCCDAWYTTGGAGELEVQRVWREGDVEEYAQACAEARERSGGAAMGLDVSWLIDEGFAAWDDIPAGIRELHDLGGGGSAAAGEGK